MSQEDYENRFNQKAAVWHGLLWLVIVALVCIVWAGILAGCSSPRKTQSEKQREVVENTSVKNTETIKDSTNKELSSIMASVKNDWLHEYDSLLLSSVIERTTIIRQDSSGRELSRETTTNITNNRDHFRGSTKKVEDNTKQEVKVNDASFYYHDAIADSVSKQKDTSKDTETKIVERSSFFCWNKTVVWLIVIALLLFFYRPIISYAELAGRRLVSLFHKDKEVSDGKKKET